MSDTNLGVSPQAVAGTAEPVDPEQELHEALWKLDRIYSRGEGRIYVVGGTIKEGVLYLQVVAAFEATDPDAVPLSGPVLADPVVARTLMPAMFQVAPNAYYGTTDRDGDDEDVAFGLPQTEGQASTAEMTQLVLALLDAQLPDPTS